jgi:RimJ/RimL family protein N-acetyltransferase
MVIYQTPRLVVREWTDAAEDIDRIFEIYRLDEVIRWIGMDEPLRDREQAAILQARWKERWTDPRFGLWAVQVKQTGKVAGTVLLVPLPAPSDGSPETGAVEVGWHQHPDSWGHGYATEAARGALDLGFSYGLPEIHAVAWPGNERSLAVMRRLGMQPQGRTSKWFARETEHYKISRPRAGS